MNFCPHRPALIFTSDALPDTILTLEGHWLGHPHDIKSVKPVKLWNRFDNILKCHVGRIQQEKDIKDKSVTGEGISSFSVCLLFEMRTHRCVQDFHLSNIRTDVNRLALVKQQVKHICWLLEGNQKQICYERLTALDIWLPSVRNLWKLAVRFCQFSNSVSK